jgi:hypothetical protein
MTAVMNTCIPQHGIPLLLVHCFGITPYQLEEWDENNYEIGWMLEDISVAYFKVL